jgi:phosphoenolpyruvate synthase/pyruvate phosphate dikinase
MKTEEIEQKIDWKLYVSRENVLLWRYMPAIGYKSSNMEDKLGVEIKLSNNMTDKHNLFDPDTVKEFSGKIRNKVEEDTEYFLDLPEDCHQLIEEFLDFCNEIENKDLSETSDEELESIFDQYVSKNTAMLPYRAAGFVLDRILDEKLQSKLEELDEVDFHMDMVTPERELPFLKERKSLLKIGKEIEEDEELVDVFQKSDYEEIWQKLPGEHREMVQNHLNEFEWITTDRYTGEPLSRDDVIESLSQVIGRSSQSLEKIQENREKKMEKLEKAKEAGGEELEKLLEIAQEYAYFRTYRMDAIYEGDYRVRNMFEEIAQRADLEYEDVIYLTVPEIKEALRGKEVSKDVIESRKEEYIVYLVEDETSVLQGEKADKYISDVDEESSEDWEEQAKIEGTVAQRGQVESEVRLVFEDADIEKVEEGDILVSPMTTPDMMVGIMDAEGIITDEGGMASHAAIVSRELGIPCVIGTETATSILQDGDKVRLDAENGVIEVIEK